MHKYGGKSLDLVPGTLRGYRCWRIDLRNLRLSAVNDNYGTWKSDDNEAVCRADTTRHVKQTPPVSGCTCGYYAKYRFNSVVQEFGPKNPDITIHWRDSEQAYVYGVIDGFGKIQLGDVGFRAQKVKIAALLSENFDSRLMNLIAEYYQVPVFYTIDKMLEEYPEPDVSELLPERHPPKKKESLFDDEMARILKEEMEKGNIIWDTTTTTTTTIPTHNWHVYTSNGAWISPTGRIIAGGGAGAGSYTSPTYGAGGSGGYSSVSSVGGAGGGFSSNTYYNLAGQPAYQEFTIDQDLCKKMGIDPKQLTQDLLNMGIDPEIIKKYLSETD